jgi:diguanylate cyclase (GGDEF)-like protein
MAAPRALLAFGIPAAALFAAYLALPRVADLPASLTGVRTYAPHAAFALGIALTLAFGRGRTFFALLTLALGCLTARYALEAPAATAATRVLHHASAIAIGLNLGLLAWLPERGIFNVHGTRYAAMLAMEAAAVAGAMAFFPRAVSALLARAWLPAGPPALSTIPSAMLVMGAICATIAWLRRREALAPALAAAIVAYAIAAHGADRHGLLVAASALVLVVAVLQDAFRMAFRDELTGLLGRRALEEALDALGRRYAIAMVDVDHFKRVNDSHGHETGDEVLKMVARRLARTGGSATAYRYGGEEFALVFASCGAAEALAHAEALRKDIAAYPFSVRGAERRQSSAKARGARGARRALTVTVSIGVAEPGARAASPRAVLAAADRALYRAKRRGRNAVCK